MVDDILQHANELFLNEQYEYAIYLYTSIIEENNLTLKQFAEIYLKRANCYIKINKHEEAINDYETSIRLDQNNRVALKKLTDLYMIVGRTNEAKRIFKHAQVDKGIKINDSNLEEIEIREKQIKEAYEKGEYERVINLIDKTKSFNIKIKETNQLNLLKARCLIYLEKFDESLKIINEYLFTSENYDGYFIRGLNLIYQQKYRLGLDDLRFAKQNNVPEAKEYYEKYKNIDNLLRQIRENKNVPKSVYVNILQIDPQNKRQNNYVYFKLAESLYLNKNFTETILYCTEILLTDKTNLNALKLRVKAYEKSGEFEDAYEDCKEIIKYEKSQKNEALFEKIKNLMINNKVDNFTRLGLRYGATSSEVKKAYFKLSKEYHPDKKVDNLAEQFIANRKYYRIKKAYEELEALLKR